MNLRSTIINVFELFCIFYLCDCIQTYMYNDESTSSSIRCFDISCRCDLTTIDCSNLNLTTFPIMILNNFSSTSVYANNTMEFGNLSDNYLHTLSLNGNLIEMIKSNLITEDVKNLRILHLKNNRLSNIEDMFFKAVSNLEELDLTNNLLDQVPQGIVYLSLLKTLSLSQNRISIIPSSSFVGNKNLVYVHLDRNPIERIDIDTFSNLPYLDRIILRDARYQKKFLKIENSNSLKHIEIDRSKIQHINGNFCDSVPVLNSLVLRSSELMRLPLLKNCKELLKIDFSYGKLNTIEENGFSNQFNLMALHLSHNKLKKIFKKAFIGLKNLRILDLEGNKIVEINPDSFYYLPNLNDLNIGNNLFSLIPSKHLDRLRELKAHNNKYLTVFPAKESFPMIKSLMVSYAYHCCEFLNVLNNKSTLKDSISDMKETILFVNAKNVDMDLWGLGHVNISGNASNEKQWEDYISDFSKENQNHIIDEKVPEENIYMWSTNDEVKCYPMPGPFLPCEDLFEWWTLRCGVWVVLLLALLGNGTVIVVLCFSRSKLDVPRFLVCNLAIADFFMGIYLSFLAVVDATTLGKFRFHAIKWQFSMGCQFAGFFGVLSSELSVFTLSVITLERHYAITHAMHLNKRLSIRHASYIMSICWVLSLILAILPIFGISNYSKFSVCLPFETGDTGSLTYIVFLMLANGLAFITLMGCYLKMYCSIRGSQAWNSNDSRIAKRMALLVFTDFICWAPIAFFALSTVGGFNFLSTKGAKILTIFVLPFNSCANPFLYAIFTKQFKKDCVLICKRLEESKVTRGFGRHKHSSNFSNRPTPNSNNFNSVVAVKPKPIHSHSLPGGEDIKNGAAESLLRLNQDAKIAESMIDDEHNKRVMSKWRLKRFLDFFCEPSLDEMNVQDKNAVYKKVSTDPGGKCLPEDRNLHGSIVRIENSFNSDSQLEEYKMVEPPLRILCRNPSSSESHEIIPENCHRKASQDSDISSRYDSCSTSTFPLSRSSISSNDTCFSRRTSCNCSRERKYPDSTSNNNLMLPSTSRDGLVFFKQKMIAKSGSSEDSESNVPLSPKYQLCRQGAIDNNLVFDESQKSKSLSQDSADIHCQCHKASKAADNPNESSNVLEDEKKSAVLEVPERAKKRPSQSLLCPTLPIVMEGTNKSENSSST